MVGNEIPGVLAHSYIESKVDNISAPDGDVEGVVVAYSLENLPRG